MMSKPGMFPEFYGVGVELLVNVIMYIEVTV